MTKPSVAPTTLKFPKELYVEMEQDESDDTAYYTVQETKEALMEGNKIGETKRVGVYVLKEELILKNAVVIETPPKNVARKKE